MNGTARTDTTKINIPHVPNLFISGFCIMLLMGLALHKEFEIMILVFTSIQPYRMEERV